MILGRRDFDRDNGVEDDRRRCRRLRGDDRQDHQEARFRRLQGFSRRHRRLQPPADVPSFTRSLSPDDTGVEIAQKVFSTSIHALEETLSILDPEAFERAADIIFHARQRDLYGIGGSAQIARDVGHKFLRIGVRTSVFDDAHMMLMSAALLGEGDVAIGFSHSGTTTAVHRAAGAGAPARRPHHRADQLCDLAAGLDRRRRAVLDGAGIAAARRERRGAHRPARHLRRGLRRRGAARPRCGRTQPLGDHGRRHRQEAQHMNQSSKPVVVVVGSLHYDIMVDAPERPRKGETVTGYAWRPKFGGKGGNQAVAAAKAGAEVRMAGAVGTDEFGRFLLDALAAGGVDASRVARAPAAGSGMSVAISDSSGDYGAVIVSGANLLVDPASFTEPAGLEGRPRADTAKRDARSRSTFRPRARRRWQGRRSVSTPRRIARCPKSSQRWSTCSSSMRSRPSNSAECR